MSEEATKILKKLEDVKEPDGSIIIETPTGEKIRYIDGEIVTKDERIKCPDCGSELEATRDWNTEMFGEGEDNPICNYVCRNPGCKGWYCNCCEEYHPFGTTCSVALIRLGRNDGYHLWGDERGRRLYQSHNRKVKKDE